MNQQTPTNETTGARLARLRRAQNITQEALAEQLDISRQAVSKWESDLAYPETDKLLHLARLYGCTVDYLLTGEEPAQTQPPTCAESPTFWDKAADTWNRRPRYFEYKSQRRWGSLPLLHINIGLGRKATGVIAIGLASRGLISLGLVSAGLLSVGLCSVGLLSFGILALGLLLAVGSIAVGAIAIGAFAVGLFALGALAVGGFSVGALAVGHYVAVGDHAYGLIAMGSSAADGRMWELVSEAGLTEEQLTEAEAVLREHCPAALRRIGEIILRWIRW